MPDINSYRLLTDTTVLANLYEKINHNLIPKLINGMFVYVIYDKEKDNLIIVNDVQGEKNLYYYEDDENFIIASTIQAILAFNKTYELNTSTIKNYFFSRHFMSPEDTCFNNIKIFKSGTINNYSLNNQKLISNIYDNPLLWISEKKY